MPLPTLPTPPSRDDPVNFAARADAFLAALPAWADAANALEQSLQLTATTGTSTTSLAVGTGSKTLTTQAGKAWAVGSFVYVVSAASVANLMIGQVTAYNTSTGALTVNVVTSTGSGTLASWVIGLSAPLGSSATFSGTVAAAVFQVDTGCSLFLSGGNPVLQFDSGDYISYDRTADTFKVRIGGTEKFAVDATDGPQRTTDASTSNGLVRKSQLDYVSAGIGNLGGVISYSAGATVPPSAAGKLITVYGNTGNITLTLPTPVGNDGKCFRFYNNSSYTATLATPAGVFAGPGAAVMQAMSQSVVVSDGANWIFFGGGWVGNSAQSWANVTGSRATGTTYYNTTGMPRQVFVESSSGSTGVITVGGVAMEFVQGAGSPRASIAVIVPPGVGYSVTNSFNAWYELG